MPVSESIRSKWRSTQASSRKAALGFLQLESSELLSIDVQGDGTSLATANSKAGVFMIYRPADRS